MSENSSRANPKPPSLDRLAGVWRRINEYKVVQWSVGYIALAYGIQHGIILTSESLDWPRLVSRVSILLLALGLPVVITLAWYHGDRGSQRVSGAELSIISILLVIGSLLFFVFVTPSPQIAAGPAVQQAGVAAARNASLSSAGAVSVAVLPFENLSADPEQEFFSAGMTEEITSALAKIPDLRVVARTSAFQFKDQKRDIRAIAQALHATHFVEGSVRKAGMRLRITAQLINAASGVSVWTDNYDREYSDVFAIQEDIATAIAGALRMPLGLKPGERLVSNRTKDLKAYEDYLRVRVTGALAFNFPNATAVLEQAVARDPNFAPAWASLATRYIGASAGAQQRSSIEEARMLLDKAEMAARKAIALDPRYAAGYGRLGTVQYFRGNWAEAERSLQQALALDPNDPETLLGYSNFLVNVGRVKQAAQVSQTLLSLEPLVPAFNNF